MMDFLKRFLPIPAEDVVTITVVDYRNHYRVEFNFGGTFYTSANKVTIAPDSPSRMRGYEGMTAEEAFQDREINNRPEPGSGFGWINLRETELITTEAHVERAIAAVLESATKRGRTWTEVRRSDKTLVEFMRDRRRARSLR